MPSGPATWPSPRRPARRRSGAGVFDAAGGAPGAVHVDVAELHAPFAHQELILRDALGLADSVAVNPSGGALAANALMVAGLLRIGEAAAAHHGRHRHAPPSPTPPRARACSRTWCAPWPPSPRARPGRGRDGRALRGDRGRARPSTRPSARTSPSPGSCARRRHAALEDAGLDWADIDAVVIGKAPDMFEGVMMPELYLAPALGAVGKPMLRVHTAGSVGGSTAIVAAHLVASGRHERVLTVAFEKQSDSDAMWALSVPQPFSAPLLAGAGGFFAPIIRAYMRRSGAPDHIGILVAVKDRLQALKNPYAHLHIEDISFDMVKDSIMLWDPIRYLETCPSSDGAAAMVLASERVAESSTLGPAPGVDPRHGHALGAHHVRRARPGEPPGRHGLRRRRLPPGRHHRAPPPDRRGRGVRALLAGSSPCGSRTSASPPRATGGSSPTPGPRPSTAATSPGTARAACCRRTPSGPRACSGSWRWPCRCGARPESTRSRTSARALGHAYGGGSQFFAMWVLGTDKP